VPKKGRALIWNNLNPDGTPNPATFHSGERVTSGHKIIVTKWFRERGHRPMFYEE
jgi:prolyl 4-hydroxylase